MFGNWSPGTGYSGSDRSLGKGDQSHPLWLDDQSKPDGIVDQGDQGRGYFVVHQTAAEKSKMFLLFCWLDDFEIIKGLSIEKRPPDVRKIVPCTIDCYDTFWPVAFALAFYREGISKKYNLRCALWFMELLLDIVMDGYWRFHRIWVDQFGGKQLSYPVPGQGEKTPVVTGWVSELCS